LQLQCFKRKFPLKKLLVVLSVIGFLFILLMSFMRTSIETPDYEVLRVLTRKAEIRRYPALILAQTQMQAQSYDENSSMGFRRVAGYIFGGNEKGQKIAMTSPVMMEMGEQTEVSFVMPKQYNMEALPNPNSQNVKIAKQAERTLAVLRSPPRCSRGHTPSMETAIAFETAAALRGRCVASSQPAVLLALLLALPLLLLPRQPPRLP
jgi:hypothetical protein